MDVCGYGMDILEGGVAGEEGGLAIHGGASPFQNVHAIYVHCMFHYSLNWCYVMIYYRYFCLHACMCECIYLCACVYACLCVCACMYAYMYALMHVYLYVHVHVCVCVRVYVYVYV